VVDSLLPRGEVALFDMRFHFRAFLGVEVKTVFMSAGNLAHLAAGKQSVFDRGVPAPSWVLIFSSSWVVITNHFIVLGVIPFWHRILQFSSAN
jgi:hypothetical protein